MRLLIELGYTRVRHLVGGIADWVAAGLPVDAGASPVVLARSSTTERRPAAPSPGWNGSAMTWVSRRSMSTLLWTWLSINLVCGVLYWLSSFVPGHGLREASQPMAHDAAALLESIYFSFVTGLSIGFGDIVPVGVVRVLAVIQGAACLLLFGAIISKFVSGRQEELTEDIHRIAFENRLGRVRTNLHLVVSEIQEISAKFGDGGRTPASVQTRIESAATIFVGELRVIHDLLYRPRAAPDEDVLESILAHLDGGLREFGQLLEGTTIDLRNAPALAASVRTLATLSQEICGECVPRAYAPHLKLWMDRVQAHAGTLLKAQV